MTVGSSLSPEEAVARIRRRNHEPLEPYPGRVRAPWKMRCITCGHESSKPLSKSDEMGCLPCSRIKRRKTCPVIFPSGGRCSEPIRYGRGGKCDFCGSHPSTLRSRLCELTNPKTGERCVRKHRQNGMCARHNDTARRHGDPFHTDDNGRSRKGKAYGFSNEEATAIMKAKGLTPLEPYHGADAHWLCRCDTCGKESTPRFASRKVALGCKHCGRKRGGKKNTTPEAEAVAIMKAAGVTPLEPYGGSHHPWKCRCDTCGKTIAPFITSIKKGFRACVYCSGARLDLGEVVKAMKEAGFTPLEPFVASHHRWKCRCETCGKISTPSWSHVRVGVGCRYCNGGPFTPNPTIVYLMKNPELKALKVGITVERRKGKHQDDARMREHVKCGFETVQTWLFPTGELAYNVEQAVLRHWREDLNAPQFLKQNQMTNFGATETASTRKVGIKRTIDYIDQLTTV